MKRKTLVRLLSLVVVILLWEYYGCRINPILFTYQSAILQAFVALVQSGELQSYMTGSLLVLTYASLLSIVIGVLLGVIMGRFAVVEWATDVYFNALYSTPMVELVPAAPQKCRMRPCHRARRAPLPLRCRRRRRDGDTPSPSPSSR